MDGFEPAPRTRNIAVVTSRSSSFSTPFIGRSPGLRRVLAQAERIAPTTQSVLVTGETGTGKEVMARFLHDRSGRTGPFVAVNCASLPKDLVESELFGHEKGSFTGAVGEKRGLIREANGGTLFLDEIGDMPLDVQVKLLRVLQERRVRPVGGRREEPVDVRVIGATLRDLKAEVAAGRFREDLLYRVGTFELVLPPLRERGDDVVLLARSFVAGFEREPGVGVRTLGRSAISALRGHPWPGNVRELRLMLLRAALVGDGQAITGADVREVLAVPAPDEPLEGRLTRLLQSSGPVSMGQVTTALTVPRTTAWRALAALVASKSVSAQGRGRGRTYCATAESGTATVPVPRTDEVLAIARTEGRVTRQRLVVGLGLTPRTASRVLADAVELGALVTRGSGRGTVYLVRE
ncbi:MAG: sigma-54 dependent transcriptional regulator [Myxococcota bacterium]